MQRETTIIEWLEGEVGSGILLAYELATLQTEAANFLCQIGVDSSIGADDPDDRVPAELVDALRVVADYEVPADGFR